MRKITIIAAAMLLGTITIFSCKKDNNNNNNTNTCANNAAWAVNGNQFVYVNEPLYVLADSLYVNFDEITPGIFKSTSKYDNGSVYPVLSNYIQPCGLSVFQSASATMDNKQEVYRLDGNIGDSWVTVTTSTGGNTITNTTSIEAKNVSVTVPKGTYSCLKLHSVAVSSAGGSAATDFYLNNKYGPIKVEGTSVHYELVRTNF